MTAAASTRSRRRALAWQVALVATVVLQFVVLYAPRAPSTGGIPYLDKVVHLTVFALVGFTAVLAGVPARLAVALLLAHAVVSELLQHFVLPHRSGDPRDAVADALGTAVGVAAGLLLARRTPASAGRLR